MDWVRWESDPNCSRVGAWKIKEIASLIRLRYFLYFQKWKRLMNMKWMYSWYEYVTKNEHPQYSYLSQIGYLTWRKIVPFSYLVIFMTGHTNLFPNSIFFKICYMAPIKILECHYMTWDFAGNMTWAIHQWNSTYCVGHPMTVIVLLLRITSILNDLSFACYAV